MEKEFVPYEQALALKELGFDEPCIKEFHIQELLTNSTGEEITNNELTELYGEQDVISAPTFSQAFRWFREKHNLLGNVYSNASGWLWEIHDNIGGTHRLGSEYSRDCEESGMFTSFDKAEQGCLIKLIEITKQQK
jgi:hypothetical protein